MTLVRKDPLVNNEYYHIYTRSIAGFKVFNDSSDYERMIELINLYRFIDFEYKYSSFKVLDIVHQNTILDRLNNDNHVYIEIISYCIMPTHIHFILKQTADSGISKYIGKVLNSYTKYFNLKHKRQGPLWSSRFKSVLVKNDEQLLHLTRYVHLNPTSAGLAKKPSDWAYSSYSEYIDQEFHNKICSYNGLFDISAKEYAKFVLDRKDYQRSLSIIKNYLIDNYTG